MPRSALTGWTAYKNLISTDTASCLLHPTKTSSNSSAPGPLERWGPASYGDFDERGIEMSDRLILWLSTNAFATWMVRNISSKLDPIVFRKTNGRMISAGPPTLPMLLLMSTGRKTARATLGAAMQREARTSLELPPVFGM